MKLIKKNPELVAKIRAVIAEAGTFPDMMEALKAFAVNPDGDITSVWVKAYNGTDYLTIQYNASLEQVVLSSRTPHNKPIDVYDVSADLAGKVRSFRYLKANALTGNALCSMRCSVGPGFVDGAIGDEEKNEQEVFEAWKKRVMKLLVSQYMPWWMRIQYWGH